MVSNPVAQGAAAAETERTMSHDPKQRANLGRWNELASRELRGESPESLVWTPPEGLRVKSLYTAADPTAPLAWREGRFVFINEPLGTMFDEIERRFGIEVVASEAIRAHAHNIKTQVTTADQLIGELCQSVTALNLRYRVMANGFEVFED